MKKLIAIALITLLHLPLAAQEEAQYRWEVGASAGLLSYQGDFNTSIAKEMQPDVALILRRILNPHMALRAMATLGKIKGSSANTDTYYPQYQAEPYTFNSSLADVSFTYEYNFWPYGLGQDYRRAKPLTPYIFAGLGFTSVSNDDKHVFTMNTPLGIGLKLRASERLNLGLEWAMHFSLSDKLDGVADPYGIKSTGLFKNTDTYSALQFTATYSFSAKCRTCHNANETR